MKEENEKFYEELLRIWDNIDFSPTKAKKDFWIYYLKNKLGVEYNG